MRFIINFCLQAVKDLQTFYLPVKKINFFFINKIPLEYFLIYKYRLHFIQLIYLKSILIYL